MSPFYGGTPFWVAGTRLASAVWRLGAGTLVGRNADHKHPRSPGSGADRSARGGSEPDSEAGGHDVSLEAGGRHVGEVVVVGVAQAHIDRVGQPVGEPGGRAEQHVRAVDARVLVEGCRELEAGGEP